MPKKRRSDGRGNVVPLHVSERHEWKCKKCNTKGKAATKKDAKLALEMHDLMNH